MRRCPVSREETWREEVSQLQERVDLESQAIKHLLQARLKIPI